MDSYHISSVKDWLYSLTSKHPGGAKGSIVDGHFEAENIQSVHHLVHWPKSLGGAEITPGVGECQHVTAIFPLHNKEANQSLLKHLSQRLFLDNNDLDQIRNLFGSKVRHIPSPPPPKSHYTVWGHPKTVIRP